MTDDPTPLHEKVDHDAPWIGSDDDPDGSQGSTDPNPRSDEHGRSQEREAPEATATEPDGPKGSTDPKEPTGSDQRSDPPGSPYASVEPTDAQHLPGADPARRLEVIDQALQELSADLDRLRQQAPRDRQTPTDAHAQVAAARATEHATRILRQIAMLAGGLRHQSD
jgi:hypothetical protein